MAPPSLNDLAKRFREMHKPGDPVILSNCYDIPTALAVVLHPATKAVATASYAIAAQEGVDDNDLTFEDNMRGIRKVATVVGPAGFPLSVDLQDGYDDIAASIRLAIKVGAVGCNLEDINTKTNELRSIEDAVSRIRQAMAAAELAGVPDFVVNARTDVIGHNGSIDDAIERARAYIAAGALTSYVWSGTGGKHISKEGVQKLVESLDGMVNVRMKLAPGYLSTKELVELGVARISVGGDLYHKAMSAFRGAMDDMMKV